MKRCKCVHTIFNLRADLAGMAVIILCAIATLMQYHHHDCHGQVCFLFESCHEEFCCNHCGIINEEDPPSDRDDEDTCGLHTYQILANEDEQFSVEKNQPNGEYLLTFLVEKDSPEPLLAIRGWGYEDGVGYTIINVSEKVSRRGPPMC